MTEKAMRFNSNKIELLQQPWNALAAFSTVVMRNSEKYGGKYPDGNWRKFAPQSQYINCALRHLAQHLSGELNDPEDGLPHLWKVHWNIAVAVEASIVKPEYNDLGGKLPSIDLKFFEQFVKIKNSKISEHEQLINDLTGAGC